MVGAVRQPADGVVTRDRGTHRVVSVSTGALGAEGGSAKLAISRQKPGERFPATMLVIKKVVGMISPVPKGSQVIENKHLQEYGEKNGAS